MKPVSFAESHSWMHAIDPRLRVLGAFGFAVVVAVSYDFAALAISLLVRPGGSARPA
ncbi:hypothetical protein DSCO28_40720 [Desulfosarcina ovata subsp. sediminis]|uniref:Cobalt ECF transporter T component CbiQ n=1 Tax=Desulfosarcina ovata subsp. sediminis TaxID=885957 RepID=A0A5K7ZTE2_9BACT|nr:hypothetical protein [Desulfosarcina ovata]BBO83506.1 hypothetical protein DSCO28_40720 [Desulfosarcina ovata subsp. sediminis]